MAQCLCGTDHASPVAPVAIIMAAGKGTRMASDLPKVVHEVADRPMVSYVVDACLKVGCQRVVVIVGYGQERVRAALGGYGGRLTFAVQAEQLGTGHAVGCALGELSDLPCDTPVIVLAGDGPLIRSSTLETLVQTHRASGACATLATSVLDDPGGYGRIVRDASGRFVEIVEEKNATDQQKAICEVNPSYYCFSLGPLKKALENVERNNLTGEYYVTDVPAILLQAGEHVEVIDAVPAEDVLSINTLDQLAAVDSLMRARLASSASSAGASS